MIIIIYGEEGSKKERRDRNNNYIKDKKYRDNNFICQCFVFY